MTWPFLNVPACCVKIQQQPLPSLSSSLCDVFESDLEFSPLTVAEVDKDNSRNFENAPPNEYTFELGKNDISSVDVVRVNLGGTIVIFSEDGFDNLA